MQRATMGLGEGEVRLDGHRCVGVAVVDLDGHGGGRAVGDRCYSNEVEAALFVANGGGALGCDGEMGLSTARRCGWVGIEAVVGLGGSELKRWRQSLRGERGGAGLGVMSSGSRGQAVVVVGVAEVEATGDGEDCLRARVEGARQGSGRLGALVGGAGWLGVRRRVTSTRSTVVVARRQLEQAGSSASSELEERGLAAWSRDVKIWARRWAQAAATRRAGGG